MQSKETLLGKTRCTLGHAHQCFSQAPVSPATLRSIVEFLSKASTLLVNRKLKTYSKGIFLIYPSGVMTGEGDGKNFLHLKHNVIICTSVYQSYIHTQIYKHPKSDRQTDIFAWNLCLKIQWAGEMTQWLIVLTTTLAEVPGSITSTHRLTHTVCDFRSRDSNTITQIYMQENNNVH